MPQFEFNEEEWQEHLFDSLAYDQPDGFLECEYPGEPEETYQTYDAWANSMQEQMNNRYYRYDQPDPQTLRDQEKKKRKEERAKRREEKEREEREIQAYRAKMRRQKERECSTQIYLDSMKRFKQCLERATAIQFDHIPWPVESMPRKLRLLESVLTLPLITAFLGSIARDRGLMKDQLMFWHTDKFIKFKPIVHADDWDQVLAFATLVAQSLTSILNTLV